MERRQWFQAYLNIPRDEYAELLITWNPKNFNVKKIVKVPKSTYMKYLVITTKHRQGLTLLPSEYTDFDIENIPLKGRDFIKELSDEFKKQGIIFGTYYSFTDWHHESKCIDLNGKNRWER